MPEQTIYYRRHLPHYQPVGGTFHVGFRLAGSVAVSVLDEVRRERDAAQAGGLKNESARIGFLRRYRRKYLEQIEAMLDSGTHGPHWLNRPEIAAIVDEAIKYRDGFEYDLIAHTIMPNHVHMIVTNVGCPNGLGSVGRTDCPSEKALSVGSPIRRLGGRDSVQKELTPVGRTDCPTNKANLSFTQAVYFEYALSNILRKLKWNTALRANRALGRSGAFWHAESYDHVVRNGAELYRTIWYVLNNPVNAGLCKHWRDWDWTYVREEYIRD